MDWLLLGGCLAVLACVVAARVRVLGLRSRARQWEPLVQQPVNVVGYMNGFGLRTIGEDVDDERRDTTTLYFVVMMLPAIPLLRYSVQRENGHVVRYLEEGPARFRDWVRVIEWWSGAVMVLTIGGYAIAALTR